MRQSVFFILHILSAINVYSTDLTEKSIVVVITSYNNQKWCIRNLQSVLNQEYYNYKIVIVDDCSKDNTFSFLQGYIKENALESKVTLRRNEKRMWKLYNLYWAIQTHCDDKDIVLEFDGDDYLAHAKVLSTINDFYIENDVWLSYARYINVPHSSSWARGLKIVTAPIPEEMMNERNYRYVPWKWSGLRAYYAQLFKLIKKEDLLYPSGSTFEGEFFRTHSDGATFIPMLEMAGRHVGLIEEVLLHRNVANPINDIKVNRALQREVKSYVAASNQYELVKDLGVTNFS